MRSLVSLLVLVLLVGASRPARASARELPDGSRTESFRWGRYRVVVRTTLQLGDRPLHDVVQVRDRKGRLVREIRSAARILTSDYGATYLEDVTGDAIPELRITAWTGGAYCCFTNLYFDQTADARNILTFQAGQMGEPQNHPTLLAPQVPSSGVAGASTRPALMFDNDAVSYFCTPHGPSVPLVLEWNGERYRDASRDHPEVYLPRERLLRGKLLAKVAQTDRLASLFDTCAGTDLVTEYYATSLLAGDELGALLSIAWHVGWDVWSFLDTAVMIHEALGPQTALRIGRTESTVIRLSEGGTVEGTP